MNSKNIDVVAVLKRVSKLEPIDQGRYADGFNHCKAIVRNILIEVLQDRASTVAKDTACAALPKSNDGKEQDAFEAWASGELYDMTTHPLHWLFLNERTYAARQGWKAALEYVSATLAPPKPEASAATQQAGDCETCAYAQSTNDDREMFCHLHVKNVTEPCGEYEGVFDQPPLAAPISEDTASECDKCEGKEGVCRFPLCKPEFEQKAIAAQVVEELFTGTARTVNISIGEDARFTALLDWLLDAFKFGGPEDMPRFDAGVKEFVAYIDSRQPCQTEPAKGEDADELHFNAQRLRNVAKLAGLDVGGDDHMVDSCRGAILGSIAAALRKSAATQSPAQVNAESDSQSDKARMVKFILGQCIHNMVVAEQAAWIEWKHGKGAEAAMEWIENGLAGPGHIPKHDGMSAQEYYNANVDERMEPPAAPSVAPVEAMTKGDGA